MKSWNINVPGFLLNTNNNSNNNNNNNIIIKNNKINNIAILNLRSVVSDPSFCYDGVPS